jgi:hypothetical protein
MANRNASSAVAGLTKKGDPEHNAKKENFTIIYF